jgi:hypothetical protein
MVNPAVTAAALARKALRGTEVTGALIFGSEWSGWFIEFS